MDEVRAGRTPNSPDKLARGLYMEDNSGRSELVLSKHCRDTYRRHQVVQGIEADTDRTESSDHGQFKIPQIEREDVAHHQDGYHNLSAERAILPHEPVSQDE